MESSVILSDHSIVISNDRIVQILSGKLPRKYKDYHIIHGGNKYLIPGLFDMHMHFVSDDRIGTRFLETESFIPLVFGVTSARIMIGKPEHLILRNRIESGEIVAPNLHIASPQLTGVSFTNRLNGKVISTYDEAYNSVIDYHAQGYDFIKLTFELNPQAYDGVITAGEEVKIPILGHVSRHIKLDKSLESGQHVEHLDQYLDAIISEDAPTRTGLSAFGLFRKKSWNTINFIDSAKLERIIEKTIENNVWNTPTNHFFVSSFARPKSDEELQNSPEWNWFSDEVRDELLSYREAYWNQASESELREKYVATRGYIIRELFRRSGKILAGSDAPEWLNLYGTGLHRELVSFVEDAGLTPFEALQTATVKPAEFLKLEDRGMIKTGYVADLLLLEKNPLEEISNSNSIHAVIKEGKYMSKDYLEQELVSRLKKLKKAILESE